MIINLFPASPFPASLHGSNTLNPGTVLPARFGVLLEPEFPRGAQCTGQHILIRGGEPNMGHSHPPPSTRNRHEHLRQFLDKSSLQFRREHQVPIALALRGEGCKYSAAYAEVGCAHVRSLLSVLQAEGNPSKVFCIHR